MPDGSAAFAASAPGAALGSPRPLGGARLAVSAATRRWAAGDRDAVLVAFEALLDDALGRRLGVARMMLAGAAGLRRGVLEAHEVRPLLELGDHRRADVRLARQVLAVALTAERLHPLQLAGTIPQLLRLHHQLTEAHADEDERDDGRGARVLLGALREPALPCLTEPA